MYQKEAHRELWSNNFNCSGYMNSEISYFRKSPRLIKFLKQMSTDEMRAIFGGMIFLYIDIYIYISLINNPI